MKIVWIAIGLFLMVSFQNCSRAKIAPSLTPDMVIKPGPIAIAKNVQTKDEIPVDVITPEQIKGHIADQMSAHCGFDLTTIRHLVDISQFGSEEVTLDLLKGMTLIFSSDEFFELKTLNITAPVGRAILCGIKVHKLNLNVGQLELFSSEILEIGGQSGKLINIDSRSSVPAGY